MSYDPTKILHLDVNASTKTSVKVTFDPTKNEANIAKHGLSFADFAAFDDTPVVVEDDRYDYGETRLRAFGWIEGAPRCLVFTLRGETIHIISFRKVHAKEMRRYE